MRINEFNSLQEFIDMYDEESKVDCEKHIGLEFEYNHQMYRMCREPDYVYGESKIQFKHPVLKDGKIGRYAVYKVFNHISFNITFSFIITNSYFRS